MRGRGQERREGGSWSERVRVGDEGRARGWIKVFRWEGQRAADRRPSYINLSRQKRSESACSIIASAPGRRTDLARFLCCVLRCREGWSLRVQNEPSPTDAAHAGHAWEGHTPSPPLVERERGSVHPDGEGVRVQKAKDLSSTTSDLAIFGRFSSEADARNGAQAEQQDDAFSSPDSRQRRHEGPISRPACQPLNPQECQPLRGEARSSRSICCSVPSLQPSRPSTFSWRRTPRSRRASPCTLCTILSCEGLELTNM